MLGWTGTMGRRGAVVLVGGAALAAALAGCGGSGAGDGEAATDTTEDTASPTTPEDQQHLASRDYQPGDCVTWDEDRTTLADTRVVDCAEPHRMQVTGEHLMPYSDEYPPPGAWDALHTGECKTAAESFLGFPLDPYGRFVVQSILPTEEAWASSERTVWCTVGGWYEGGTPPLISEDVRTAEQAYRYEPGQCLARNPGAPFAVVPCDQPHHREVTGQVDVSDLAAPPSPEEVSARCSGPTEDYLGGPAFAPWRSGYEVLSPESWAAGTRLIHCYVLQADPAGSEVALTGSARG